MTKYKVNEIFHSIQGEGYWSGRPATFIRLQGCNLRCAWCDTKYTWTAGGKFIDTREITRQVRVGNMAVITGGEPMLWDLEELLANLAFLGVYTQIETNGTLKPLYISEPSWLTVSPKPIYPDASDNALPASLAFRGPWEVDSFYYTYANEFKWVVDGKLTLDTVEKAWLKCRRKRPPVFSLMPEGCPPEPELVHIALSWLEKWPTWRYSDRLQWRIGVK